MPEQVYNPEFDVFDGSDGSNASSIPSSSTGLIDSLNQGKEEPSVTFWSNITNAFRDFFKNGIQSRSFLDSMNNPGALKGALPGTINKSYVIPPASDEAISKYNEITGDNMTTHAEDLEQSSDSDYDPTNPRAWYDMLSQFYEQYRKDSLANAQRVEQFNIEEAQKLRDWQEYMSSTSYQRAVEDLKKAGINPLLAFQHLSGASTPSGAMASGTNSGLVNPGFSSLASSYSSILGQNKNLSMNMINILIRLLTLFF